MNALILDGSEAGDAMALTVQEAVVNELKTRGWDVDALTLRDLDIAACPGGFGCWVKTPGLCGIQDAGRDVTGRIIRSDLVVLLTPVTFGGYSSAMKKVLDRTLPLVLPFFTKINGEMNHRPRYGRYPSLFAIGLLPRADEESERLFKSLVGRNVRIWHNPLHAAVVVSNRQEADSLRTEFGKFLTIVRAGNDASKKALLLIGSPKRGKSTSEALGAYLIGRMRERGFETKTMSIAEALKSENDMDELLKVFDRSDITILSFPLYMDSLPYPSIKALERIAEHRKTGLQGKKMFAALCNCGFPEAGQTESALALCRQFARETGLEWAGGLGLGFGKAIDGRSPGEIRGTRHIMQSLDLAAEALCGGKPIPQEAVASMSKRQVPGWLYVLFGGLFWKKQARAHNATASMGDRPYYELCAGNGAADCYESDSGTERACAVIDAPIPSRKEGLNDGA